MPPFVSNERRLVLRILRYWEFLRGERRFPAPVDVNPADLPDDWQNCLLLDTSGPQDAWEFRHVGEGFSGLGPVVAPGVKWISSEKDSFVGLTTSYIPKVLDRLIPISISGEIERAGECIRYRSILLPLSADGDQVTGVLGAANRNEQAVPEMAGADGGAMESGSTDRSPRR